MSRLSRGRLTFVVGILAILVALVLTGKLVSERIQWNRTLAPVRDAISMESRGGLHYPEAVPVTSEMEARHAAPDFAGALEASLSELRTRFEADPEHDPELAFWLGAGLTATGRLETARGVVDIGRVHNPFDERLWNLEVILILREGNTPLARERLETLIDMFPENTLAQENLDVLKAGG